MDTIAVGGDVAATPYGPQVQQWNATTVSGTDPPAVTGFGSSRSPARRASPWPGRSVATQNRPMQRFRSTQARRTSRLNQRQRCGAFFADRTTSRLRTTVRQQRTGVTLADTYNATNLSLVSYTPSAGTTCTNTATTINCTLPTPFAAGATATVAVVVSTTAAGFYPNTAVVSDSGTPPDSNTGNNTYVALAPVVSVVCGTNTLGAGGTLGGTINTYWPGNGNVGKTAAIRSVPLTGREEIAAGSLLLVIMMRIRASTPRTRFSTATAAPARGLRPSITRGIMSG